MNQTSEAKPDHLASKVSRWSAIFRADLLHALEPILRSSQEDERYLLQRGDRLTVPWREVVGRAMPASAKETIWISPRRLGMFKRLFRLFATPADEGGFDAGLSLTFSDQAAVVRLRGVTDFIGVFMPLALGAGDIPPAPTWLAAPVQPEAGEFSDG